MNEETLRNIIKEYKWYERVVVILFKKQIIKAYHIGRIICWNSKK